MELVQQYPKLVLQLAFLRRMQTESSVVWSHQVQLAMVLLADLAVEIAGRVVEIHILEEGGTGQDVVEIHVQVVDTNPAGHHMATFPGNLDQGGHLDPSLQEEEGRIQEVDIVQRGPSLEVVLVAECHFVLEVELLVNFDFEKLMVLAQRE